MSLEVGRSPLVLKKIINIFLILAFATVCWGCGTSEEKKAKHLANARKYVKNLEYNKAVIEYRNVIQVDPKDASVHYELGQIYLELKKGPEAFRSFQRVAELDPDHLDAQLKLGNIYLLSKKTEEARKKAELILEKNPENIDGLMLLAGIQVREKKRDEAIQTLERSVSIDPKQVKVRLALGRLFFMDGKYKKANAYHYRGLALLGKKEGVLAQKDLIRAVELNPILIGARLILAGS